MADDSARMFPTQIRVTGALVDKAVILGNIPITRSVISLYFGAYIFTGNEETQTKHNLLGFEVKITHYLLTQQRILPTHL